MGRMIIQSKTYGLTNNFNQLKLKCQNNELLQFYRTMKKLSTKNTEKSAFFQDLLIFTIMVGMVGMPIMPIMNLSKSGKLTFQKKGLQLLPTTSTTFPKDLEHSFEVIGSFIEEDQGTNGAQILGIHAEGPMISEEFRGSHNPELLVKPSVETFKNGKS